MKTPFHSYDTFYIEILFHMLYTIYNSIRSEKIIMYKNLVNTARQIVTIANARKNNANNSNIHASLSNNLTQILMSLSLDKVIALQTIMYLGRDQDPIGITPDEIFINKQKTILFVGINDQDIEVGQIVEKIHLGDYLTTGYKILGINL